MHLDEAQFAVGNFNPGVTQGGLLQEGVLGNAELFVQVTGVLNLALN